MSIRSYWLMVLLSSFITLLVFCLVVILVIGKGVLKSPAKMWVFLVPLSGQSVFALVVSLFCDTHLGLLHLLDGLTILQLYNILFGLWKFSLKSTLSDNNVAIPTFFEQCNISFTYVFIIPDFIYSCNFNLTT